MEVVVLQALKLLGYGTHEEIQERLHNEPFDKVPKELTEVELKILRLIVKRWSKKKVITSEIFDGVRRHFLRRIPWLARLDMIHVEGIADTEAKDFLRTLEEAAKNIMAMSGRQPNICNFVNVECVFETIDVILGGDLGKEERMLDFPRDYEKNLYIKPNWLFAYFRGNSRLWDISSSVAKYIMPSKGEFLEQPETFRTKQIRVKEGHDTYEAIPPKTQFKTVLHLPLKGYDGMDSLESWIKAIKSIEEHPIAGIGANFKVFGGRIKLVEHKILN